MEEILKIIKLILNKASSSKVIEYSSAIAYISLSLWLPEHFSITSCSSYLTSCMLEEVTALWCINKAASILNGVACLFRHIEMPDFSSKIKDAPEPKEEQKSRKEKIEEGENPNPPGIKVKISIFRSLQQKIHLLTQLIPKLTINH